MLNKNQNIHVYSVSSLKASPLKHLKKACKKYTSVREINWGKYEYIGMENNNNMSK